MHGDMLMRLLLHCCLGGGTPRQHPLRYLLFHFLPLNPVPATISIKCGVKTVSAEGVEPLVKACTQK
ncbi:unnamed protein product [Sphenostylis stenocarpa]|uniref:Uncharacterized protein n=1 Tax=Sphenostylis stenocarpa TaxID=92480 RepID=A0AA86T2A8_9FABA|nr:unnamed protein product [Sphenostylis stenocarpa]